MSAVKALFASAVVGLVAATAQAEAPGSIGLAIVYDTSGSMREPVKDASGQSSPKYLIANRAFLSVVDRLEAFHKAHPDQPLRTSLVVFQNQGGKEAVPFGEFDPQRLRAWIQQFAKPDGATPLGAAIQTAAAPLLRSDLAHRHILIVTDGQNTAGPEPASVIPALRDQAAKKGGALGLHFVAFDVAAKVFDPVKKLDATVVSAANEQQLGEQLTAILERKILLEDEEPAPRKP